MKQRLFVYGTLMPGQNNARQLRGITGKWVAATVTGRLYPQGIGKTRGYPALVLDRDGPRIPGYLLTANFSVADWKRLDAFETDAYTRVSTSVRSAGGRALDAFVYVVNENHPPPGHGRVFRRPGARSFTRDP